MSEAGPSLEEIAFVPRDELQKAREALGPSEFLEIEAPNLTEAHRKLGKEVKFQVKKILRDKLNGMTEEDLVHEIKLIRACRQEMEKKLNNPKVSPKISEGLQEYFDCLSAWANGIDLIEEFNKHDALKDLLIDGLPLTQEDLALWLQNDEVGCQTGMLRKKDGNVLIWHTEEDTGDRVDKPRIVSFKIGKNGEEEINAFIYPDLLPGPAFSWKEGFFQAVDSLYLKQAAKKGSLANVAAWLTLRLGKEVDPAKVVEAFGPFIDGYALNIVQIENGQVKAKKIEFAGGETLKSSLAQDPESLLFQVNIISKPESPLAKKYQDVPPEKKVQFERRIQRTGRALHLMKVLARDKEITLGKVLRMLAFRTGGEYANAQPGVKAYLGGEVSERGIDLFLNSGSASREFLKNLTPEEFQQSIIKV